MKLGNIYDLNSFQGFGDSARQFNDAYAGTVLARNLTHVNKKIFEKKYPELTFVNSGIAADNTGGYAKAIQSLRLLAQGGFAEAGDQSDNAGIISLSAEDNLIKVREFSAKTGWSQSEIEESKLQNINLIQQYMAQTNKVYLREVDSAGMVGIKGAQGLLNHTDFTSSVAANTAAAGTALQLYTEVSDAIRAQHDAVSNIPELMANRVTMPTTVFNVAQSRILDTTAGSSTVLKALRDNFPGIVFNSSVRANVVGGTTVTAIYSNNEDALVMRLPVPLKVGEMVKKGSFQWETDYIYRIAGLDVLEKAACHLLKGL